MKRFLTSVLAAAGCLVLPLVLPASATARSAKEKSPLKQTATEQKQEKRAQGAKDMADGQIKTVTCKGRAMDMAFDNSYEVPHLRTDNYFKVNFSAINFTPSGTLNPCKTAQGMYARVHYYRVKGHPKEGELITVELRK